MRVKNEKILSLLERGISGHERDLALDLVDERAEVKRLKAVNAVLLEAAQAMDSAQDNIQRIAANLKIHEAIRKATEGE